MNVMSLLTAFGLAAGAGAKAFVPVLLIGMFHYTPWFELSGEYAWIGHPMVIGILMVLVMIEIYVDANPELGNASAAVGYVSKFVAGALAVSAVMGQVDPSLMELAGSGLLGGVTAMTVHGGRNLIRRPVRDSAELAHDSVGKAISLGEAGTSAAVSSAAILSPVAGIIGVVLAILSGFALYRITSRRRPCASCGNFVRPEAVVCAECGADLAY